ncbi:phosphotransferase [Streptomyces formicae]|uniref:Phosphotransferase n=1 Tax=Streptomyces formicae TaxID=1616117 RepID=A0A291Q7U2_9ACTN|nr:phosphotransferase [Streptomyces formicae]ATL27494.1 phosphotransferase [Streptomyces formicae]
MPNPHAARPADTAPPDLSTVWLRTFLDVARHGSFTVAARELGWTQSAVSRQIAALEAALGGAPLFDRLPRGVRPTAHGRALLPHATDVMSRLTSLGRELTALRDATGGLLRVGAFATADAGLVPRAIARFRAARPGVTLVREEGLTPALLARVADGGLDLAVVSTTGGALPADAYELHHLLDEPLYVALPSGHPLAALPEVRFPQLAAEEWISGSSRIEGTLLDAAVRHGLRPRVAHVVAEWTAKQGYVAAGLGVTLIPALAAESVRQDIALVPLRDEGAPARAVYAATPRGHSAPPAVAPFLRALRAACPAGRAFPQPVRTAPAAPMSPTTPTTSTGRSPMSTAPKTHADEPDIDEDLVRRLVGARFPAWAGLPVRLVGSAGTSNVMYRLGTDMVVRLPRRAGDAESARREHEWLRRLSGALPVPVPAPLAMGEPGEGYPYPWSVFRWLEGETPVAGRPLAEPALFAEDMAAFLTALRGFDTAGAPASYRGDPLASRDADTRAVIAGLRGVVDTDAVTAVWDAALRAAPWQGPGVWVHGDLQPGNVLVARGRLSAVIDFECMGTADPAVDLIAAWYLMDGEARRSFRAALGPATDDAMWARGRGWALTIAVNELSYYRETNLWMADTARHVIGELTSGDGELGDGEVR